MSQHSLSIPNESGLLFRQDVNNALQALASLSSGSSAPGTTYAFQLWIDTSGSDPILKIRNAANSAWIVIGQANLVNFGMALLTGAVFSGPISFSNTNHIILPIGTTAQRPVTPSQGMIRFNTDQAGFEGYNGTAWAPVGGGRYTVTSVNEAIGAGGTVTTTITDARQLRYVSGSSGAQTSSTTPFGTGGGWADGTEITLVGTDDSNTLTIPWTDVAKGVVGNFTSIEITKNKMVTFVYNSTADRWIAQV